MSCPGDVITLPHAVGTSSSDDCDGTSFRADIVSVKGNTITSHLSLIPTSSNDGQRIACYYPSLNDLIQECTLDVPCK